MKFLLTTAYEGAATRIFMEEMGARLERAGHHVVRNEWRDYGRFDVVLFMTADSRVAEAKADAPHTLVGICDPKREREESRREAEAADFLLCGSIEQRDVFLAHNPNIFVHLTFPETEPREKVHSDTSPVLIGYHGNRVHLQNWAPRISWALEQAARKHAIRVRCVYNHKDRRYWRLGVPEGVEIEHLQWRRDTYVDQLAECDIGIANVETSIDEARGLRAARWGWGWRKYKFGYNDADLLVRLKHPTNPSRMYEFSQLGIPVVSDWSPSTAAFIEDGVSGYLAHSKEAWLWALERLIESPERRNRMAAAHRRYIDESYAPDLIFRRMIAWLEELRGKRR